SGGLSSRAIWHDGDIVDTRITSATPDTLVGIPA
ncbi:MAG: hypothetical protein QOK17_1633, partial [Sphingomonadales bacterium]|nr:hypothetical protein [Sphingomonadales bacterium]